MIAIRDATVADAGVVADFNARLAVESEGKELDRNRLDPGVRAILESPDERGRYFLAELDGVVVGQLSVTFEWSDWRNGWFWWFQSVYVIRKARRAGVFSALYDHVMNLAREREDVCGLRLYVLHVNETAQHTYLSRGMKKTGYEVLEIDFTRNEQ